MGDIETYSPIAFLLEYLDSDTLPAFVFDLSEDNLNKPLRSLALIHSNPATLRYPLIVDEITRHLGTSKESSHNDKEFDRLLVWLIDVRRKKVDGLTRRTLLWCGLRWTAALVRGTWLVLTAVAYVPSITTLHSSSKDTHSKDIHLKEIGANTAESKMPAQIDHSHHGQTRTADFEPDKVFSDHIFFKHDLKDSKYTEWLCCFDWTSSPLGPPETWSVPLLQASRLIFASPEPVAVVWGKEYALIYNEPYSLVRGDKYPGCMGRPAREYWSEHWDEYKKVLDDITASGHSLKQEGQARLLYREGNLEEGYFDLTFCPILGTDLKPGGVYIYVAETTKHVVSQRRMRMLLEMSESMVVSPHMSDSWQTLMHVLEPRKGDVNFAALWDRGVDHRTDKEAAKFQLRATAGMDKDKAVRLLDADALICFGLDMIIQDAFETGMNNILLLEDGTLSADFLSKLADCGVEQSSREAMVLPIRCDVSGDIVSVMIIGACPLRKFGEEYKLFLHLLKKQIESAVTGINIIDQERARLAEYAAIEGERKFKILAENAPIGVFMYDHKSSLKYCNASYEKLCGMTFENLKQPMAWIDAIHEDFVQDAVAHWERLSKLGGPFSFEVQFKHHRDSIHVDENHEMLDRTWCLVSVYPETSGTGEFQGVLGCITDISHVKWAEKIQTIRLSEALELKRQQENFLDMTSHEIRNPLNAIYHCASELVANLNDHIKHGLPDEESAVLQDYLELSNTISYCANHQKRIVDDILTLSKLDSRLLQMCPASTNPKALLQQVLGIFDSELRASEIKAGIEYHKGYQDLGIDLLLLDSHRISQIIINLLTNAIKFVKQQTQRELLLCINASLTEPSEEPNVSRYVPSGTCRKDPTEGAEWGLGEALFISFSIQDTGPGITDKEANSLFKRFSQASNRTYAQYGGSGLGLFISRELAEMHGGRIGLSSQPGSGSTFTFYVKARRATTVGDPLSETPNTSSQPNKTERGSVPLVSPSNSYTGRSRSGSDNQPVRKPKILVVEDNLINQKLLKRLLTKHGYNVSVANHGMEALEIIQASTWCVNSPHDTCLDVVLCDIEMPVMDGKTCVRRIRQLQDQMVLQANIPVVAVTGNARIGQVQDAQACGFDAVIAKPYNIEELLSVMKKYIS